jgi:raffinose/stachyose/melibiose transport system permease protein
MDTGLLLGRRPRHYLYLAPALVLFAGFIVYPIIEVVHTSLAVHDAAGEGKGLFANFSLLIHDPVFWTATKNMAIWAALTISIQMGVGGTLAYLIERYGGRSKAFYRTIFLIPVVTSVSVIGIVWTQIYAPDYGPLQYLLQKVGISLTTSPLGSPTWAIVAIVVVNIWEFTGFSMLLYIVGLHRIPQDIFDAADVDGSRGWRLAKDILIPMLAPVTKSLLLLGIIGTLQTFPLVYLMTSGGPDHASEVYGTYIFTQDFILNQSGYAAALSVVVLLVAILATAIQMRFLGTRFAPISGSAAN